MNARYLGSWVLPSGNSCDAYLIDGQLSECRCDVRARRAGGAGREEG